MMGIANFYLNLYKSLLNKRDENIWIFGSWLGSKFADNSKYLFLKAIEKGIDATWITKKQEVYNELRSKKLPVEMFDSKKGIELQKKAGTVIYCVGPFDFDEKYLGGSKLIDLWHGISIKKVGFDDQVTNKKPIFLRLFNEKVLRGLCYRKTYHLTTSPKMSQVYMSAWKTSKKHIIELGYPRNDIFFDNEYKEEFSFEFLDGKKMITYMPTHRKEGRATLDMKKILDLDKLNETCKQNNYIFVIKKHFYHKKEMEDLKNYSNIVDITHTSVDPQELLKNTDILISDYSGAYIDYILLDRPMIFYNFDYEDYLMNDREMYFDYNEVTPGPKIVSKEELTEKLSKICSGEEDGYAEERKKCLDLFFDGRKKACSEELIEIIKKL